MQHKTHIFRAATMDEALDLVHQQLGKDFVIVDSKEIPKRRLLPWPTTQHEVEICAEQVSFCPATNPTETIDQQKAATSRTIRTLAESKIKTDRLSTLLDPIPELPAESAENEFLVRRSTEQSHSQCVGISSTNILAQEHQKTDKELDSFDDQNNWKTLQSLIAQLERQNRRFGLSDVPNELFEQYHKLVISEVEDDIARDLIVRLRRQASAEILKSTTSIMTVLTAMIEREMRCAPPIVLQPGRTEIVSLIGPTGVGKTTTLAKLAGHYQFHEGARVGLISVDACRVGAAEQLQAYADILQVPLRCVSQPDELRTAISELDDVDLILIDTAGQNPFDQAKMNDLNEMIQVSGSHHVLLTLSMAAGPKMLSRIASQFATAQPTSLVLTKLDEIPLCGGLLSVAREIPHPVSYLTTGLNVPEQIEPANPARMARLVLGRDQILHDTEPSPALFQETLSPV